MARASPEQMILLEQLRKDVLEVMHGLEDLVSFDLNIVSEVGLGLLRKSSTQRHGVTRWTRSTEGIQLETVDLHPVLLEPDWNDYARFVLFHEFLHAIGLRSHNQTFRWHEALWPDSVGPTRGVEFTDYMRMKRAKWFWVCSQCEKRYPRQRAGKGKYQCRTCRCRLEDVPIVDEGGYRKNVTTSWGGVYFESLS